jgi:hypothetical protein
MPAVALGELQSHLRAWAEKLSANVIEPPVLVRDICASLGVKISKKNTVPEFKAYLSVDPSSDHPAVVLLPAKDIGGFERFCVAHELAHYLLFMAFHITPQEKSEYWKHETLCDDFARHLLMPAHHLPDKLENPANNAWWYLRLCGEISLSAWVPWMHAARRIAECKAGVAYLRCQRLPSKDFKFMATTHPSRKGQGKLIKRESPECKLWRVFDELLWRAEEYRMPVHLDVTNSLVECRMNHALGFDENVAAAAKAQVHELPNSEYADIRIAVGAAP